MPQLSSHLPIGAETELCVIQALFDKGEHRKVLYRAKKALKNRADHVGLHALAGFSAHQLGEGETADALLENSGAIGS